MKEIVILGVLVFLGMGLASFITCLECPHLKSFEGTPGYYKAIQYNREMGAGR